MRRMPYGLWKPRVPLDIAGNGIALTNYFASGINPSIFSAGTAGMSPPVVGGIEVYTCNLVVDANFVVRYVVVVNGWIDNVYIVGIPSFNRGTAGFCYVIACDRYRLMAFVQSEFYGGRIVRESIAADYRWIVRLVIIGKIYIIWVASVEVNAESVAVERIVGNGCASPVSRDASGVGGYVIMSNGYVCSSVIPENACLVRVFAIVFDVIVRDKYVGYTLVSNRAPLDSNAPFSLFDGESVNDYIGVLDTDYTP